MVSWENGGRDSPKGAGLGMVKLTCLPHFLFCREARREGPEQRRGGVEFHEDTHVQPTVVWAGQGACCTGAPAAQAHRAHITSAWRGAIHTGRAVFLPTSRPLS